MMTNSTLLAVDDQPENLCLLERLIEEHIPGCELQTANNAEEALGLLAQTPFDAVLIDVRMPGMDGIEMCKCIRSQEATRNLPVILITAQAPTPELRARGVEAGAELFISKSPDGTELVGPIKALLRMRQAEEAARKSEARALRQFAELNAIYDMAPIGLGLLDRDLRFVKVNRHMADMGGVSPAEHVGRKLHEVVPGLPENVEADFRTVLETRVPILDAETHGPSPVCPGEERVWLGSHYPVVHDGEVLGLGVVARDVTERIRAEAELERYRNQLEELVEERTAELRATNEALQREVEQRKQTEGELAKNNALLNAVIDQAPFGIVIAEGSADHWTLTVLNKEAARLSGTSAEEVRGLGIGTGELIHPEKIVWEMFHPDGTPWELADTPIAVAFARGEVTRDVEMIVRGMDGIERTILSSATPIANAEGKVIAAVAIHPDISERKRAEAERERLTTIIEATSDIVSTAVADGQKERVTYLNQAGRDYLGWLTDPQTGEFEVPDCHPRWAYERVRDEGIPAAIAQGRWQGDTAILSEDGQEIPVSQVIMSHKSPSGKVEFLSTIMRDISELRRAEDERLSLERQVQHAQKLESLGVLAGGIAHDFNNLLVGVLGNTSLLLDELAPTALARTSIEEIETAAKRAADLCRQMLAYSGRGRFVIEAVDLNAIVREMGDLLAISISKNTALTYSLADDLPAIEADATQIGQVVMNLITNASEAIGKRSGVVSLKTSVMDADTAEYRDAYVSGAMPEGACVHLEVTDTGAGMDEETRKKLFDPFFTTKFAGRGLGMSAVLGIVRGHKGAIRVDSQFGRGTTFHVLIPASRVPIEATPSKQPPTEESAETGTILLVDDEEAVLRTSRRILEHKGFTVLVARDGCEAIERFREQPDAVSCVVLDLTMPNMGGEEAFRMLRQIRKDVKVILASGFDENEITQRFAHKGVAGFLQKPFSMQSFLAKIEEVSGGG